MICRGHIRASKDVFQFFVVNSSMGKLISKSDFSLFSSLQVKFERFVNRLEGQNLDQSSISTWSMGIQFDTGKIITWGLTNMNKMDFLQSGGYNAVWD